MPKRSICSEEIVEADRGVRGGLREAEDRFHVFPREAAKAAFHHNFFYLCFLRQRCGGKRCCQYGYCQRTPSPERNPLTVEFHHVQDPWDRMVATAEIKRFDAATPARTRSDKPFLGGISRHLRQTAQKSLHQGDSISRPIEIASPPATNPGLARRSIRKTRTKAEHVSKLLHPGRPMARFAYLNLMSEPSPLKGRRISAQRCRRSARPPPALLRPAR